MNKKTRNTLSGILVGVASVFAVINFADIPAADIRNFILTTLLFFFTIVLLALLAVSIFKLLGLVKKRITNEEEDDWSDLGSELESKMENKLERELERELKEDPDQDDQGEDKR